MTTQEIKALTIRYAISDTDLLEDEGSMAITGTKHGCLNLSFENGTYMIVANKTYTDHSEVLNTTNRNEVIEFIASSYIVEEAV